MPHTPDSTRRSLTFTLALAASGSASLIGCAAKPAAATLNPKRNRLGVLVIAGEGLNSTYQATRIEAVSLAISQKFAEAIAEQLIEAGTQAQAYINGDKNVATQTYVAELMAARKRDGLVQVTVEHVKTASENTVYLAARYNRLAWQQDASGESFVAKDGVGARYKLLGAGEDGRHTPFGVFAKQFADLLLEEEYIGEAV